MSNDPRTATQSSSGVGSTSAEGAAEDQPRFRLNVYEVMMAVSLICVTLACIFMVVNIRNNFQFVPLPWRTETGAIQTSSE